MCYSAVTCPPPENGTASYVFAQRNIYFYGEFASFLCEEGSQMSGSTHFQCLETGKWSDSPPNCCKRQPRLAFIKKPLDFIDKSECVSFTWIKEEFLILQKFKTSFLKAWIFKLSGNKSKFKIPTIVFVVTKFSERNPVRYC